MISGLIVLVLGVILAQPGKFSGLAFVIVISLKLVFLVILPRRKQGFALDGLIVRQHVLTVFWGKWPFWFSVEVWVCGASVLPCLCSLRGALGQNGSFTEVKRDFCFSSSCGRQPCATSTVFGSFFRHCFGMPRESLAQNLHSAERLAQRRHLAL